MFGCLYSLLLAKLLEVWEQSLPKLSVTQLLLGELDGRSSASNPLLSSEALKLFEQSRNPCLALKLMGNKGRAKYFSRIKLWGLLWFPFHCNLENESMLSSREGMRPQFWQILTHYIKEVIFYFELWSGIGTGIFKMLFASDDSILYF